MPALTNAPVLERPTLRRATETHRCRCCGGSFNDCVADSYRNWWCPRCYAERHFICAECGTLNENFDGYNFEHDTGEIVRICRNCRDRLNVWNPAPMDVAIANYGAIGSKRKFGVEIETATCAGYRALRNNTLFGAKYDCSISGMEFISPILYGDEGLAEIERFCDHAAENSWSVDSDCGLHIHLDMRDENADSLKSIAYAYLLTDKAWRKLADPFRADNCTYCRPSNQTRSNVERAHDWHDYCDSQNRYELCNLTAYNRHGTYEIRLYQGSIDKAEICNWIKIHTRFCDWAATKTLDELDTYFEGSNNMKWEGLKLLLGDFPLVRYWISKRRRGNDSTSRLARPRREMQDDINDACDDCDEYDEVDSCR